MAELLLVDNDPRIAELVAWFLERRGHRVRRAASYAEARERIAERAPELMLADLELGRESGREELPRLAAEGALPPTLVVSGFLDAATEDELLALHAVRGTLSKPFDVRELVERVEGLVGECTFEAETNVRSEPSTPEPAPDSLDDDEGWIEIVPRGGGLG